MNAAKSNLLLGSVLCAVIDLTVAAASADTRYVWQESPNPTPPYTNWDTAAHVIQDAVDGTQPGDTVIVTNGVYAEGGRPVVGLLTNQVAIDKPILLQSVNGPDVTIISGRPDPGGGNGPSARRCVYLWSNAVLSGFMLTNGHTLHVADDAADRSGGGVYCEPSALVTNCVLTVNSAGYGGGASGGSLFNCILNGNTADHEGGATDDCELRNCTLVANAAQLSGGGVSASALQNCIAYYNTAPSEPNWTADSMLDFSCTFPRPAKGTGNITHEPAFADIAGANYRLRFGSPCIDAGTNLRSIVSSDLEGRLRPLDGNGDGVAATDMGAYEHRVLYVSSGSRSPPPPFSTWATAAKVLQDAVDAAQAGDTVLVANGSYNTGARTVGGGALWTRIVIDKAILVQSVNGPAVTVIQGKAVPNVGNDSGAIRCAYVGNNAMLSGFTLSDGHTRTDGDYMQRAGGGAWCEASALGSNCVFTGNSAYNAGGGVSGGTLCNCILIGNSASVLGAGGGACGSALYNCLIRGNSATVFGGGVYGCSLYHCTLVENSAGGHFGGGGALSSVLYNCIVYFGQ